uniref:Uncharacterized protein n=1 Tax=Aegilops tauschii subsp. strangulata TaxID=200361 RepID=A0A453SZI9_AEGTS
MVMLHQGFEGLWEIGAQLLGHSIGETPNVESPYLTFTLTWLGVRLLHIWFMLYCLLTNKKIS